MLGFFCYLAIASTKTWLSDIVCMSKSITNCCGSLFLLQNQCLNVHKAKKKSLLKCCRYRHVLKLRRCIYKARGKKSIKWVTVSGQNLTDPNQEVTGSFAPMFPKGSDWVAECFHRGKRFPEGSPPNSCSDFYTQYEGSCSIHVYKYSFWVLEITLCILFNLKRMHLFKTNGSSCGWKIFPVRLRFWRR